MTAFIPDCCLIGAERIGPAGLSAKGNMHDGRLGGGGIDGPLPVALAEDPDGAFRAPKATLGFSVCHSTGCDVDKSDGLVMVQQGTHVFDHLYVKVERANSLLAA